MLRLFRPKAQVETKPVDPRQWAEAFKHASVAGSDEFPAAVKPHGRPRGVTFTLGS